VYLNIWEGLRSPNAVGAEFVTEPPTLIRFWCVRGRFYDEGAVKVAHKPKSCSLRISDKLASSAVVLQQFTRSQNDLYDDVSVRQELAVKVYTAFRKELIGNITFEGCYMSWMKTILIVEHSSVKGFKETCCRMQTVWRKIIGLMNACLRPIVTNTFTDSPDNSTHS
jgi:hypothetical protein